MATCPRCSSEIPEGADTCATCGYTPGATTGGGENPWENRSELGLPKALMETVKMVVTNPVAFYGSLSKDGDWTSPILYAIIIGWIGAVFNFIWSILMQSMVSLPLGGRAGAAHMMMSGGFQLVFVIFAPVFVLIGIFIWAGLLHLAGMVLGDAEQGFEMTFKVVSYTTTTQLANIIPMCGGAIGAIWGLILVMVGLKEGHRTEPWKAILTPILVIVFCCVCVGVMAAVFGAGIASLAGMAASAGQ